MSIQKTTTELETLKINYLTQEMYEAALENDEINSNELYVVPDTGISVATANELGGIKTGYTTSGYNRAVQVDENGNAYITQAECSYLKTAGDQRNVATIPNDYKNQLIFQGIKTSTAINLSSSNNYSYLIGLRGWTDSTGGPAYEIAFNYDGIYARKGLTTTWESWYSISPDYSTTDLVAGSSQLPTGQVYLVYE